MGIRTGISSCRSLSRIAKFASPMLSATWKRNARSSRQRRWVLDRDQHRIHGTSKSAFSACLGKRGAWRRVIAAWRHLIVERRSRRSSSARVRDIKSCPERCASWLRKNGMSRFRRPDSDIIFRRPAARRTWTFIWELEYTIPFYEDNVNKSKLCS